MLQNREASMPHTIVSTGFLLLLGASASAVQAAPDEDRFTFRASAFDTDSRIRIAAEGTVGNEQINADFADVGSLGDDERSERFEATYRIAERHRLSASYYDLQPTKSYVLDEAIGFEELPEYEIPAGSRADVGIEFRLATLMYEYALVENEQWTLGAQVGIHWAKLAAFASVDVPDIADDRVEWERKRRSIALGARLQYRPSEKWRFGVEVQGYDTDWGNFVSENGHFERGGLLAEYRFTEHVGIHAGYDWFRLKLRDTVADEDYFYSLLLDGELRVHGPTLGLTVAF